MNAIKYTKAKLEAAVAENLSLAEAMRWLGLAPSGSMHAHLKHLIKFYGINTSHFIQKNKGLRVPRQRPDDVLVLRSAGRERSRALRRAMLEVGFLYECAMCNATEWRGKPLTLNIDHMDGNSLDNRRENLRFLCPNCHSQTPTHSRSKMRPYTGYDRRPTAMVPCKTCQKLIEARRRTGLCGNCYRHSQNRGVS